MIFILYLKVISPSLFFKARLSANPLIWKRFFLFSWPSSFFFSVLAPSDRPKFLAFTKKKGNEVVKPFFTWTNSFNLKNEHRQRQEHFLQYIVHFVILNMWMLTFNVILGYQGILFRDFSWFFFFFFSNRATDPISGNAFDAKRRKKRGWPIQMKLIYNITRKILHLASFRKREF